MSQLECDLLTWNCKPPVVVDGSIPHCQWPGVTYGIIWYSFTNLWRMEGYVGLAVRGYREICWCYIHRESNPGRLHSSIMVYPLLQLFCTMIYTKIWKPVSLLAFCLKYQKLQIASLFFLKGIWDFTKVRKSTSIIIYINQ